MQNEIGETYKRKVYAVLDVDTLSIELLTSKKKVFDFLERYGAINVVGRKGAALIANNRSTSISTYNVFIKRYDIHCSRLEVSASLGAQLKTFLITDHSI